MIDTLKIHLERIDNVVAEYNDSLEARAYAARERYTDAKAALYLVCREANRLNSKMVREAEDVLHRAEAAMREAIAAVDAADEEAKKSGYWLERVCAGQRLEYARREGYSPAQIKAYKREYENACAAYEDYMNDVN